MTNVSPEERLEAAARRIVEAWRSGQIADKYSPLIELLVKQIDAIDAARRDLAKRRGR